MHIKYTIHRKFLNELVFLKFAISSLKKCLILVLGANVWASSAKFSESCAIGLSFFILITLCLTLDLMLPPIPSTTTLPWEVAENSKIIFLYTEETSLQSIAA